MGNDTCSANGCTRAARCRGYCDTHYNRMRRGIPMDAPIRGTDPPTPKGTCTIDGCEVKVLAAGLCRHHYSRNRKYGDPLLGPPPRARHSSDEERFWSKVDKTEQCWTWIGTCYHDGYGEFKITTGGRSVSRRAHRMAYEYCLGPVPEGMVVDHMCFNRKCCNPDHLRAVTRKQNCENRQGAQSNSRSGIRGVWWVESLQKWEAVVMESHGNVRKRHCCGKFDTAAEATAAVVAKRNELFTHNDADRG